MFFWKIPFYFGHSPFVYFLILAHSAAQALLYVLLLQPHTGSYCMVHTQLVLGFSTHLLVLQETAKANSPKAQSASGMFFISEKWLIFLIYDLRFWIYDFF